MTRAALLMIAIALTGSAQEPIKITIHANKSVGQPIPSTVFGTFLEPIGNSTYNGLWAEILQNPSFESGLWWGGAVRDMIGADPQLAAASHAGIPLPWEALYQNEGNRYEPRRGDAANSFESLAIFGLPDRETGVRQQVYLPVHRQLTYRGSLFVKHLSGGDTVHVSIRRRDHPTETLASAEFHAASPRWQKYPFKLTLNAGQLKPLEPADFVISTTEDERLIVDQASLMPVDADAGLDPDMVRMAKDMHTPLLRFGGNFTSAYHWRDGVGPLDKRVSMRNVAWGIPETNQFGTDEFLHFCKLIGAQPQIALNLGTGTPEEAADWVRYVDGHWSTHSGLLWELGNELWGNFNDGYPTLGELAGRTLKFSQAVKSVDPSARLIATGEDPDKYQKWNAVELSDPAGTFSYLSTHFVVGVDEIAGNDHSPEAVMRDAFALPVGLERKLHDMQKQIDEAGRPGVHIAFTEWLFHCCRGGRPVNGPRFDNMGGAVIAGGFMNMLLRNSEVVPISDMTGIIEFAGIWKKRSRVYATPAYYTFRMFSTANPKTDLQVENDSPTYDVHGGVGRLPDITHVPYLDAVAVRDADGNISLFCVNRDASKDLNAEISMDGFNAKPEAEAQAISAPNITARNDEVTPDAVKPVKSTVQLNGNSLRFTFRHASVTRIDFPVK